MKALVRNPGETVKETDGVAGIDWETGAPLTNQKWSGGPYTFIKDYKPSDENVADNPAEEPLKEDIEETTEEKFEFNGKMYTARELKELLGSL